MQEVEFSERGDKLQIEEGLDFVPKFDAEGLIPAMAIDAESKQPLMLAYMNREALQQTLKLGEAVYWSRSRKEMWHKGATSGHVQVVKEIFTDCDQDTLILYVKQLGAGACHTGRASCFYRRVVRLETEATAQLELTEQLTFNAQEIYRKA